MSQQSPDIPTSPPVTPASPPSTPALLPGHLAWSQVWVLLLSFSALGASLAQIVAGPSSPGLYVPTVALLLCLLTAWYDAATGRVPNALTLPAIALGLVLNSATPLLTTLSTQAALRWLGAVGPIEACSGFAVCTVGALLLAFLPFGAMGMGDVKLLAAMGALLGLHGVAPVLFCALVIALPLALLNLLATGRLNRFLRALSLHVLSWLYLGRPAAVAEVSKTTVPLAVPLALGLIATRVLPVQSWLFGGN